MKNKSQARLITILFVTILITGIVLGLQAFPGGSTHLAAQNCYAYNVTGAVNCAGVYPGVCGAAGDRVGCVDGINESIRTSGNGNAAAVNLTYFNSSVNNCESVSEVFLCYRRSVIGTSTISPCNITVDANNWSSSSQVNGTCPAMNVQQPLICNNITSLETWTCGNFFGSSGTKAVARVQIAPSTGTGTRTLNVDALFFNVTYSADTNPPIINFTSPTETSESYANRNYVIINVTASDSNLANITINLYNSTRTLINSSNTTSSNLYANFTNLENGIYYFNATACDSLNQCNSSETRNVTIDLINPNINFSSLSENSASYLARRNIVVNITINDTNFKNATIFLYNSTNSLINSTNTLAMGSLYVNFSISNDGAYYFNVTAYDKAGNKNQTETRNITLDITRPTINFTTPSETSGSYANRNYVLINVTASDSNLANITINLYNSTRTLINSSNTTSTNLYANLTNLGNGIYYFNATTYDLAGNSNSTETRNITIDLINPGINFTNPTRANGSIITVKNIIVNISVNDTNYANATLYMFNSSFSIINTTFSSSTNIYINFTNLSSGWYYFNATAYDLAGNLNSTETRAFFINRTVSITAINATPNPIFGGNTITITAVNASHSNNDTLYFYCDNSTTSNICTGGTGSSGSSFPYSLTCTFITPNITAVNNVSCRVFDGDSYSSYVNTTYNTSIDAPLTNIVSVAGDTIAPYFDNVSDSVTPIVVSGDKNIHCRWSSSDLAYSAMTNNCYNSTTLSTCNITGISEGIHTSYISCADDLGIGQDSSQNLNAVFTLDYTAPTTSDDSSSTLRAPNYTVTITELDNVDTDPTSFYCSSSSEGCSPINSINNGGTIIYTSANRGVNYLRYYSIDDAGNSQTIVNKTININQLPIFLSASDNAVTIKGGIIVNVSVVAYDNNTGQVLTLRVCDSASANFTQCNSIQYCSTTGTVNLSCTFNSETDSVSHTWYAFIFDELGEGASNNSFSGSYTTDSSNPVITLVSPLNASTITQNSITISMTVNESLTNAWYSLNSGKNNISMINTTLLDYTQSNTSIADGTYNLSIWANDSVGNIASLLGNYFIINSVPIDTTPPIITINSPQNATYNSASALLINISSNEALAWAGYKLNSGILTTLENSSTINWKTTLSLAEESIFNLTIYANDTSNNQANKTIIFYTDSLAPRYSDVNANPNPANQSQAVNCSISWSDGFNISSVIISENSLGNYENHTISFSGTSGSVSYLISGTKLANIGTYNCIFYATDAAGNTNSTSKSFTIQDLISPVITITSPSNATYSQSNLSVSIITSENASSAWFSLNGTANISMSNTSATNWNYTLLNLANSAYNIIFYANDSSGNTGNSSLIYFSINTIAPDSIPPIISIITLNNGSYYLSTDLELNISSNENLSWAGYSLNSGALNSMSNSSILNWNASLLGLGGESTNTLIVYANDTSNNQANKTIIFYVDNVLPDFIAPSASPNPANETQSVVCNIYINDSSSLSSVKIGEDASVPGTWQNHTVDLFARGYANYTIINVQKGSYNCIFYATDAAGNYDYTSTSFIVNDVVSPIITIISPSNTTYNSNSILLSLTLNENASSALYSFDAGITNLSLDGSGTTWNATVSKTNGAYVVNFYVNDTSNNFASSSTGFSVDTSIYDTSAPTITIWSPTNASYNLNGNILINITTDEALTWAGYKLDLASLTNLGNVSTTNWNYSLTGLSEGIHNLIIFANDTSSNKNQANKTITFYVDLTNPSVDSFSCADSNDSQDVNCSYIVSDVVGLNYLKIGWNAIGSWQNSSQLTLSGTSSSGSYIINEGNTTPGTFQAQIYLYDLAGRSNITSFDNVNIYDDNYPRLYNITYSPNTTDLLDPGVSVAINVTIVEDYSFGDIFLMYKNSSASSWSFINMTNLTTKSVNNAVIYNSTLVSLGTEIWQFKINASDGSGNQNISSAYTFTIATEEGYTNTTDIAEIVSFSYPQRRNNNTLGSIFVNNTGDSQINVTINISSSIRSRFNVNYSSQPNLTITLASGENASLVLLVNTTSLSDDLYQYNISVLTSIGNSNFAKNLNIVQVAAPLLYLSYASLPTNVTRGDSGVSYSVNVVNLGTTDSIANDVYLNWSLPYGFILSSGNLSRNLGSLGWGISGTNAITVTISSTINQSSVSLMALATASNADQVNDSKIITISDPVVVTQNIVTSTGGGSGGGRGASAIKEEYSRIIEVVRGQESKFSLEVYNKYSNKTLEDLVLDLTGFPRQYVTITPSIIKKVNYGEKAVFEVTISAPAYEKYSSYDLIGKINGFIVSGSSKQGYIETQKIKLLVQEYSREDTIRNLTEAQRAIEDMKQAGFNIVEVERLYNIGLTKLNETKNKEAYDSAQKILDTKERAFKVYNLLGILKDNIYAFSDDGITGRASFASDSVIQVYEMALAAFERGDYISAEERLRRAEILLALERKGNFFLFLYLYWHFILIGLILFLLLGIISFRAYRKRGVVTRIEDSGKEEDNIRKLVLEAQRKYFTGKISAGEYHTLLAIYNEKLSKLKKERINLRNKRIKILSSEDIAQELEKEKESTEKEIRNMQSEFYTKKSLSETEYKGQFEILNERLAEIEDERLTNKLNNNKIVKIHGEEPKKQGLFKRLNWKFKKARYGDDSYIKEKIEEMLKKAGEK